MNKQRERVNEFLKEYGMDYQSMDIEKCCDTFMADMSSGLQGFESTLRMIPTYISLDKEIPVEEPVIVMDAGGTNFRVAVVHFDRDKKPVIEDYMMHQMPGSRGEISREEFYQTISKYLEPVVHKSNKIGFCFSYATEILPNKDGKLIRFSKEVQVRDMAGREIGEDLRETLHSLGYPSDKSVVLLNDTVATLLGGKASYPDRVFESFIGFILGTGTNTCYIEENTSIEKVPDIASTKGSMLVNVESGGYGKAPRGRIDLEFDSGTVDPGEYSFEKMISGRYQGELLLAILKKAALEGLFTDYFADRIKNIQVVTTQEMNDYLYYPYGGGKLSECCKEASDDHITLYYFIDSLVERAAKLVTVNLSSIMQKTGRGKNPNEPVCIAAEGSTFYKSKLFISKLEYYIKDYLNDKKGLYCEFVKVDNATLIGTAIAGLL